MEYPYLGEKIVNNKHIVILFTDNNEGTIVVNETENEKYRMGKHGEFDESEFDFFPIDGDINRCVRLTN